MEISEYFEKEKFNELIKNFFENYLDKREIYNEFSFQHELAIYLRSIFEKYDYKVEFERNAEDFGISYDNLNNEYKVKKEIDISIYKGLPSDNSIKYAIELKYPLNKQYPEQMFSFIKDIRFMQELVNQRKFTKTFCITLVDDKNFYEGKHTGNKNIDIYKYFRNNPIKKELITKDIYKPTGKRKYLPVKLKKTYDFNWNSCTVRNKNLRKECKYYIIECT